MKAPENTNTLLQQLMGTMQSFMEENKKEKSELVSTLPPSVMRLATRIQHPHQRMTMSLVSPGKNGDYPTIRTLLTQ